MLYRNNKPLPCTCGQTGSLHITSYEPLRPPVPSLLSNCKVMGCPSTTCQIIRESECLHWGHQITKVPPSAGGTHWDAGTYQLRTHTCFRFKTKTAWPSQNPNLLHLSYYFCYLFLCCFPFILDFCFHWYRNYNCHYSAYYTKLLQCGRKIKTASTLDGSSSVSLSL